MDPFYGAKTSKIVIVALFAIYLWPYLVNVAANVALKEPTPYWQEHWDSHEQNLTLVYSDPYIAFYADTNDYANRTDLFTPLSFAWEFVHGVYNSSESFGADPRLYVILQSNKHNDSRLHLYTNVSADYRNVVECGEPKREGFCTLGDILDSIDVLVKKVFESQEKPFAPNLISEWQILFIVVYDKLVQDGMTDAADKLKTHFQNKTASFPQGLVYLNQKWYLWIYENYGGSKAIQSFLSLYDSYTNRRVTITNSSSKGLSTGEFVFLWSEAVGSDFRDLAYFTFGWFRHYRRQFEEARKKLPFSTFPESYPNSSWYHAQNRFQNKYLNLTLFDGHVAFYFENSDDEVERDTERLTTFISKVWRFLKEALGPLGPDPILHLHLYFASTRGIKCNITSEDPKVYVPRLHLSCFGKASEYISGKSHLVNYIMSLVFIRIPETNEWPAELVSSHIILLNIFLHEVCIAVEKTEDAKCFKEWLTDTTINYDTFAFNNWYSPIFSKYGGFNITRQFLNTLHSHWPKKEADFVGQMNAGEWVHFWSAAVGDDLSYVAIQTREWSLVNGDELIQARRQYSQLNDNYVVNTSLPQIWKADWGGRENHDKELHLVYSDKNVAFYLDSGLNRNTTWPFKLMSGAWEYVNHKYGPLTGYPLLFIFLHNTMSECTDSKTERNTIYDNKNVIDCGRSNGFWSSEVQPADLLLQRLGRMILADGKNTGKWLGYKASRWSMEKILVYDIYLSLGREENARRWKEQMLRDTDKVPNPNTFWFRDFYYPIYNNFGGSQALSNFFFGLYSKWPYEGFNSASYEDPDLEALIHIWSAAVGENQWRLAANAFGWNIRNHQKFSKARRDHPLNYTVADLELKLHGTVPRASDSAGISKRL